MDRLAGAPPLAGHTPGQAAVLAHSPCDRRRQIDGTLVPVDVRVGMAIGFSLIELLMVLAILAVFAGMLLPMFRKTLDGDPDHPRTEPGVRAKITRASMAEIRATITGAPLHPGFKTDLRALPGRLEDLFVRGARPTYDPVKQLGWNGPYLQESLGKYHVSTTPPEPNYEGFSDIYGTEGAPAAIDAWGRPIVLQWPDAGIADRERYVRLVSAGADGQLNTPSNVLSPDATAIGDDLVVYLTWAEGQ